MTSKAPSPRIRPSSEMGIVASAAGMISQSTEAREMTPGPLTARSLPRAGRPRPDLSQPDDRRRGGRHPGHRRPLADRVILVAAGEQVRRRQPHLAEQRAIGAAPDGRADRLDALGAHSLLGGADDVGDGGDVGAPVAVLRPDLALGPPAP